MEHLSWICEVFFSPISRRLPFDTKKIRQATVMLATNVAFLAIPGVIPTSGQRVAQILSSASLVFSIGSIITGLVLIRRNRTMMEEDAKTAVR
jgi:hypothetical protein